MTVTSPEKTQEEFVVCDDFGPFSITGRKIADLSWTYDVARERGYTHWTDIFVFSVDGETYRYGVQILGRSLVYHRDDSPCHKGMRMTVGKLAEDEDRYDGVDPCQAPGCKPKDLQDLKSTDTIWVEMDLPKYYKCSDADDLVATLSRHGRRQGRPVSGLNMKALQQASLVDDDVKAAVMRMPRP